MRGVSDDYVIDAALIRSGEARNLSARVAAMATLFGTSAVLNRKDESRPVRVPTDLLEAVLAFGRKGLSIQRYKGLGEMNPEQLWETTLDPEVRSLLQVKVSQADTADEMFSKLMGDVVEPRRIFIQENALKVANLDV